MQIELVNHRKPFFLSILFTPSSILTSTKFTYKKYNFPQTSEIITKPLLSSLESDMQFYKISKTHHKYLNLGSLCFFESTYPYKSAVYKTNLFYNYKLLQYTNSSITHELVVLGRNLNIY